MVWLQRIDERHKRHKRHKCQGPSWVWNSRWNVDWKFLLDLYDPLSVLGCSSLSHVRKCRPSLTFRWRSSFTLHGCNRAWIQLLTRYSGRRKIRRRKKSNSSMITSTMFIIIHIYTYLCLCLCLCLRLCLDDSDDDRCFLRLLGLLYAIGWVNSY